MTTEKKAPAISGMGVLVLNCLLALAAVSVCIYEQVYSLPTMLTTAGIVYLFLPCPLLFAGLKVLKPREALVLTLFGSYIGTLKGPGFFFVNPFAVSVNPTDFNASSGKIGRGTKGKIISLKTLTLNNDPQKINDKAGNPINIAIVVIWRVVDTAKAVFDVDNYTEFLSIQCDSALRGMVSQYAYDDKDAEISLRGNSSEIAEKLRAEIQTKVGAAGIDIQEARITHLSYAPEIAAAMLQRQQAAAIIDARQMIVDGAVGMVEMALDKLSDKHIVELDEERKAAMVSNLLVVLCSNKDAQPIVNSGSLY
ncbi:MAG: SPFH domain-containing protein [Treponema sp.]|jgi:regulator of protease activity HflC (stomatin/prohibitin superfamily)|nr:SPFH domain-containing protein [Treponema sp.]